MSEEKELISIDEVMMNIRGALESMDGDEVAEAHNAICCKQIKYEEDSMWTEED